MAERLTIKGKLGNTISVCDNCGEHSAFDCIRCARIDRVIDRLAALEDILFTPDGKEIISTDELHELARARQDGRYVVLPCKVGDTVWTNVCVLGDYFKKKDRPYRCEVVFIGLGGKSGYVNVVFKNGRMHQFVLEDFGKTVFLTHDEALAKLGVGK